MNEFAVMPTLRPSGVRVVTTVTPVAYCPERLAKFAPVEAIGDCGPPAAEEAVCLVRSNHQG